MSDGMPDAEESRRAATGQAAAWLVALRGGRLSASERGEFIDWLRESPVHIAEMLRITQVDRSLEAFKGWAEIPVAEQRADNVVRLLDERPSLPRRRAGFLTVSRAIAASLVVTVLAVGGWLALREAGTTVRTQLAERREMTLMDGSVVTVAPLSELRIRFTSDRRSVELLKGHVLFDVSPDRQRPFVVKAGTAVVRAVGTSFDVERGERDVRVTVVKGRVMVARDDDISNTDLAQASAAQRVLLAANEQVVVPYQAPMASVREVNGMAQVAWATGTLVFDDETVAEVVRRFNLHNVAQIQVLDPQLADRRVSGTFKASDPRSFVAFIHTTSADPAYGQSAILLESPSK